MKIDNDQLYHGAALLQIAEHPSFTAINATEFAGARSRSAFTINKDLGVFLKYASQPRKNTDEYVFTFHADNLEEIAKLKKKHDSIFIGLVCVSVRQICCLSGDQLDALISARRKAKGSREEQYQIYVWAPPNSKFRVYVSPPGKRGRTLGEIKVARNCFPDLMFE